jgi:hypothetical protein
VLPVGVHVCEPLHMLPQPPQLTSSVRGSTQTLLHAICGAVHVTVVSHPPFAQVWPAVHLVPHEPQFCSSVVVSTQSLLQLTCGAVHDTVASHAPSMQT